MAKKKSKSSKSAAAAIADAASALSLNSPVKGSDKSKPPPRPKDADEIELEKLVFGDLAGFQDGLRQNLSDDDEADEYNDDTALVLSDGNESDSGLVPDNANEDLAALHDDELFFMDTGADPVPVDLDDDEDKQLVTTSDDNPPGPQPAWQDSDDERVTISLTSANRLKKYRETFSDDVVSGTDYVRRLRVQYEKLYPPPKWALPEKQRSSKRRRRNSSSSASSSSDSDMDLDSEESASAVPLTHFLQSPSSILPSSSSSVGKLRPDKLDITRHPDANRSLPSISAISSLSFHPHHPLLMTSGRDHTLRLYHIDTKSNPPVSSLFLKSVPVTCSSFHPDGRRVFAGGRRRYFHIWDLESGAVEKVSKVYGHKDTQRSFEKFVLSPGEGKYMAVTGARGTVNILSATTSQWIAEAKIDGAVSDLSFYPSDEGRLTIANTHGTIWEYDLGSRQHVTRWNDEGATGTSKIALSEHHVAVGDASGVVNIYDRLPISRGLVGTGETLRPMRTLEQLVTRVGILEFGMGGQVLAVGSKGKKDALRMVHLPSGSVYANWPTNQTPLGKVESVAFAAGTGMMAVGNEGGKVRLWEIRP